MTRLGNLDFDCQILEAIKDGRFVVFAGAGVSMVRLPTWRVSGLWPRKWLMAQA